MKTNTMALAVGMLGMVGLIGCAEPAHQDPTPGQAGAPPPPVYHSQTYVPSATRDGMPGLTVPVPPNAKHLESEAPRPARRGSSSPPPPQPGSLLDMPSAGLAPLKPPPDTYQRDQARADLERQKNQVPIGQTPDPWQQRQFWQQGIEIDRLDQQRQR